MRSKTERQGSFADVEFAAQGITLDPLLRQLSEFLDAHGELVERVHQDLVRGLKRPQTGREGLTAAQVLRAFVLQRVKDWDLRELRERIADGYTLRRFTAFYSAPVPTHRAFHRGFCRLQPATLRALNEMVVEAAVALGLEDARQVRADTTVVETNIHFPTDSTLLWDCVRVLTRLGTQVFELLPTLPVRFANGTRCARRRMQQLQRMTPTQRHTQQQPTYRALLTVVRQVVANGRGVGQAAAGAPVAGPMEALRLAALVGEIEHYAALADRVMEQARRRVLAGEQLAAAEKVYSIFEPHTDLLKRGKVNRPVEFGHKVLLVESRGGLITDYRVLQGNPSDDRHVPTSLAYHRQRFGTPPTLYAADRGFYSPANIAALAAAGVAVESVPQRGGRKTAERAAHEKTRRFKRAQKFRAGIEGRISVLFRGRGMKRCRLHGSLRFEVFVGAAVLANNLLSIATHLAKRHARRRRAA